MSADDERRKLIQELSGLGTATVSDACDRLGIAAGCLGIKPILPGGRMAGSAYTVRYVPTGAVTGSVGDYIDEVKPGDVIVLDNHGRLDCTVWGDILTTAAVGKGISGTVIEGVCRDVPGIVAERYPVFARGSFMMTGKDRVMVDATQVIVSVGGRQVKPGDVLVGDDSGVVVVPREHAEAVAEAARSIHEAESRIVEAVRAGVSIGDARRQFGYHTLQSKRAGGALLA